MMVFAMFKPEEEAVPGYSLSKREILSAPKPTPEELAADPDHPWSDGFTLFRCIVHGPDGRIAYISHYVESKNELETKEFWRDFWDDVFNNEQNWLDERQIQEDVAKVDKLLKKFGI